MLYLRMVLAQMELQAQLPPPSGPHCHHNNFSTDLAVRSQPTKSRGRGNMSQRLWSLLTPEKQWTNYFLNAYYAEEPDDKLCTTIRLLKQISSLVFFLAHNEEIFGGTLILLHPLCKHTIVKGPVCSNSSQMDKTGCFFWTRLFIQLINHLC